MYAKCINHLTASVQQFRIVHALNTRKHHLRFVRIIKQNHLLPCKEFSNILLHIIRMKMRAFPIIPLKQYIGTISHIARISQHTQMVMYPNLHAAIFH